MCGRFTLRGSGAEIARHFDLPQAPALPPRYNVAPGQEIAAVCEPEPGRRRLERQRWGLVPRRSSGSRPLRPLVNARSETASRRRAFAEALRQRRCLIPADGFYEWGAPRGGPRRAFHVRLADEGLFGIAGLWEPGVGREGRTPPTCALLTTEANADLASLHDRMPAILLPEDYARWLDPRLDHPDELRALLRPLAPSTLEWIPVGGRVNRVEIDDPSCLEPPEPERQGVLRF